MRIGLVGQGDGWAPTTWSGIPFHLGTALVALGAEVEQFDANPPRPWTGGAVAALRAVGVRQPGASHGPELAALRRRWLGRELRRRPVDVCVQLNTGFRLPDGVAYATFNDLTVPLGLTVGWSDASLMSGRRSAAWQRREAAISRSAVACFAASDWMAASLVRDHGVDPGRVLTTGFGVNAGTTVPDDRTWTTPRLLFVGREWDRKNGPRVVAAFRRLRERHPDATLTLVGEHPRVDDPGVVDVGPLAPGDADDRSRLVELFQASTCFVLPSLMEPFGIAYLEAGAAGIASIGTRRGGAATAIGDGGIVVEPEDIDGLVDAMARLSDPLEARRLGARAADNAARFTWERVASTMLDTLASRGPTNALSRTLPPTA